MTREKAVSMFASIPSYVQSLIAVGALIFGVGTLYGDIQDIKKDLAKGELSTVRQSELASQINVMQMQLTSNEKNSERTLATLDSLSNTLRVLSVSVARLEGKVDSNENKNRKDKE